MKTGKTIATALWVIILAGLSGCQKYGYDETGDIVDLTEPPSYAAVIVIILIVWFFTKEHYKDKRDK